MSTLGLFIVVFGLLIIVTRSPLIFAPERTRTVALQLLNTTARFRALGVFVILLGALAAWVGTTEATSAANFVNKAGIIVLFFAAGIMIPFAGSFAKVFRSLMQSFSVQTLRIMGILAVLIGAWIVLYGVGL